MTRSEERARIRQGIMDRVQPAFAEHPTWGDAALAEEYGVPADVIEDMRPLEYRRFRKAKRDEF